MGRKAVIGWIIIVASLAFLALESRSEAALGCFRDTGFAAATCSADADCGVVGGVECTMGFCFCPNAGTAPFCACAPQPAPVLSRPGMFGSALLVCAIGLLGLWRTVRARRVQA